MSILYFFIGVVVGVIGFMGTMFLSGHDIFPRGVLMENQESIFKWMNKAFKAEREAYEHKSELYHLRQQAKECGIKLEATDGI